MAIGFFALLDDITVLLDDIAAMSKVAAKKTAGILGDDLAVNAEKSAKFEDHRELPVLYKIAFGSFINKLILLPLIFTLSYFLPQAIMPILVIGGLYLAYEGFEKILEYGLHKKHSETENTDVFLNLDEKTLENKKVKSAIITDFILSIEIIIITLSSVLDKPFMMQLIVTSLISILAVVVVYELVGLLIRLDNIGFWIQDKTKKESVFYKFGGILIKSLPILIKILGVVGTIAMLLVAGGIFIHNFEFVHHIAEQYNLWLLNDFIVGLLGGLLAFIVLEPIILLKNKLNKNVK